MADSVNNYLQMRPTDTGGVIVGNGISAPSARKKSILKVLMSKGLGFQDAVDEAKRRFPTLFGGMPSPAQVAPLAPVVAPEVSNSGLLPLGLENEGTVGEPAQVQLAGNSEPTPEQLESQVVRAPEPKPNVARSHGAVTTKPELEAIALTAANEAGIPYEMLAGIITKESNWNPIARSPWGDRGIAQINDSHSEVTDEQADNPEFAIPWAAKEIAARMKEYNGNEWLTLASYQIGKAGVRRELDKANGDQAKAQQALASYKIYKVVNGVKTNEVLKTVGDSVRGRLALINELRATPTGLELPEQMTPEQAKATQEYVERNKELKSREEQAQIELGRAQASGDASAEYEANKKLQRIEQDRRRLEAGKKVQFGGATVDDPSVKPATDMQKPSTTVTVETPAPGRASSTGSTASQQESNRDLMLTKVLDAVNQQHKKYNDELQTLIDDHLKQRGAILGNIDDLRKKMQAEQARYTNAKVDPRRLFRDSSKVANILRVLGVALGAAAEGLSLGKVPNTALKMFNAQIDQDIKIQLEEIKRSGENVTITGNLLSEQYSKLKDLRAATLTTKKIMLDSLIAKTNSIKGLVPKGSGKKKLAPEFVLKMNEKFSQVKKGFDLLRDLNGIKSLTKYDTYLGKVKAIFGMDDPHGAAKAKILQWAKGMAKAAGEETGPITAQEAETLLVALMGGNWDKLRESKSAILQKIGNHYSTLRNTIIGLDANNDISELRWMLEVPKEFSTTANQPKGMTKR